MSEELQEIRARLKEFEDKKRAEFCKHYFKTGPGEYGEGAQFMGIAVPVLRKLTRDYRELPHAVLQALLSSPIHEERALSLMILTEQFSRGDAKIREKVYRLYFKNSRFIDSWDLVDISAGRIVGAFLNDRDRKVLYKLAGSSLLWERRMAIIATQHFIQRNDFADTLRIAEALLSDREDLIHKAVGWMLREVGKRNLRAEEAFLKKHYKRMPRTMLRYAIEKFPESKRQKYLQGKVSSTRSAS